MKMKFMVLAGISLAVLAVAGCGSKGVVVVTPPPASATPQMTFLTALGSQATGNMYVGRKNTQQALGTSPLSSLAALVMFQATPPPLNISMSFSGYCSGVADFEQEVFGIGWLEDGNCANSLANVFKATDGVPVVGDGTLQVLRVYAGPSQPAVVVKVYVNGVATGITCTTPSLPTNKCWDDTTAVPVKDGDLVIVTVKGSSINNAANVRVMLGKY